jgi:hypothetical protein
MAATNQDKHILQGSYTKERETKNTIRYAADADADPIDTIYIQKFGLLATFDGYPETIKVTIESSGA